MNSYKVRGLEDYLLVDMLQAVFKASVDKQFRTNAQMSVLVTILTHANGALECIASYEQLTQWTALSQRTVQTHVKALCDDGWLTYSKGNTGYANVYQVQVDRLCRYAKYYLPQSQSEVTKYKGHKRKTHYKSLGFNTKDRPYVLREDEDLSLVEDGTYFVRPNEQVVYLMRDLGGHMQAIDTRRLSDFDRAYKSRVQMSFETDKALVSLEDVPY
ncbi:helix-turn-helix domain-containing protein [Vibrio hangzhouensis]|uniref:Helix-turn-helix domain-containing protein n=1 Tax=Vibrio hangzhouensis TaxID=462991 RepID=A0A1H6AF34_9VIBR|nr:helix-turn-helix domain-containing protein [Vibrio hangzhouensis]SEG46677.1 Helix-turn-helix domain-containing protein [Vibrio hangzhouensis]